MWHSDIHGTPAGQEYTLDKTWSFLCLNTLRPRQGGRHFADDTFKPNVLNENVRIAIKISLKFVLKVPINNIPSLVQIMAWRRPGDKPLSEPMMISLLTHICVTRPQWVNSSIPGQSHFADDTFKRILMNEKFRYYDSNFSEVCSQGPIRGPIGNKVAFVQVVAWHRKSDKPLPEPCWPSSPTHICGTRGRKKMASTLEHTFKHIFLNENCSIF